MNSILGWFGGGLLMTGIGVALVVIVVGSVLISMILRKVVPTDEVHIVQSRKKTVPYGSSLPAGNVYLNWPSWMPRIGITRKMLSTTIFGIDLPNYDAFDIGKVPFRVDIKAFFQIEQAEVAAQRVDSLPALKEQLRDILSGAVRTILAQADIVEIMESRGIFGDKFTEEVQSQLAAWGVSTVKNIEFMDIKDSPDSKVVSNIMAKKKSFIEKESRIEVAGNIKEATVAEIDNLKEAEVRRQEADLLIGQKTADKDKQVGIANEVAQQEIKEAAKVTAEKDMAVKKVEQERQADIDKNVAVILAEQDKTEKTLAAEAGLVEQEKEAKGIQVVGAAKADAEQKILLAPVEAQITLAKEIGENKGYQEYLLGLEKYRVEEVVGTAKASALSTADLKIIANTSDVESGITKLGGVLSSGGGTDVAGMLEGIVQSDTGKAIIGALTARVSPTRD